MTHNVGFGSIKSSSVNSQQGDFTVFNTRKNHRKSPEVPKAYFLR